MEVDIYRREEAGNKFSYLIVPHGQWIPDEATNVDWQLRQRGVHVGDAAEYVHPYEVEHPREQIEEKGYAITRLADQVPASKASV
jgi:hypothetical protein